MNNPHPTGPVIGAHDSAPGFTVTSSGSVIARRPVPRNLGITLVTACEPHLQWDAMRDLEQAMDPLPWLDMVLRCSSSLPGSPMQIVDGMRRCFPEFRPQMFLNGAVAEWWNSVTHPLTVWRGCYEGINEVGMCYSQDPRTASNYVRPGACGKARAILVEATVNQDDYIACRRERGELVVLVLPERPVVVARWELPLPDEFFWERTVPLRPLPVAFTSEPAPRKKKSSAKTGRAGL